MKSENERWRHLESSSKCQAKHRANCKFLSLLLQSIGNFVFIIFLWFFFAAFCRAFENLDEGFLDLTEEQIENLKLALTTSKSGDQKQSESRGKQEAEGEAEEEQQEVAADDPPPAPQKDQDKDPGAGGADAGGDSSSGSGGSGSSTGPSSGASGQESDPDPNQQQPANSSLALAATLIGTLQSSPADDQSKEVPVSGDSAKIPQPGTKEI